MSLFTGTEPEFIGSTRDGAVFFGADDTLKGNVFYLRPVLHSVFIGKVRLLRVSISTEILSWELSLIGVVRPPPNGSDNENKAHRAGQNNCAVAASARRPKHVARYLTVTYV